MIDLSRTGRIAIDLSFALMLLSGAPATVNKRILMFLIIALTLLTFTEDLMVEFKPASGPAALDSALKVFCMATSRPGTSSTRHRRGPSCLHPARERERRAILILRPSGLLQ